MAVASSKEMASSPCAFICWSAPAACQAIAARTSSWTAVPATNGSGTSKALPRQGRTHASRALASTYPQHKIQLQCIAILTLITCTRGEDTRGARVHLGYPLAHTVLPSTGRRPHPLRRWGLHFPHATQPQERKATRLSVIRRHYPTMVSCAMTGPNGRVGANIRCAFPHAAPTELVSRQV